MDLNLQKFSLAPGSIWTMLSNPSEFLQIQLRDVDTLQRPEAPPR